MIRSKSSAALILVLFAPVICDADTGVEDIRRRYRQVWDDIDMGTGPYVTELAVNTGNLMYPAVGIFQEQVTFHWESQAGYSWPVLVVWSAQYSAIPEHGELLYSASSVDEQGSVEAVFQFLSTIDIDGNLTEYRWWWSGGELLQASGKTFLQDGGVVEFVPEGPESYTCNRTPGMLMELFETIHG